MVKNFRSIAVSASAAAMLGMSIFATAAPAKAAPNSAGAPAYTCSQAFACPKFSGNGVNIRENPLGSVGNTTILGEGYVGQKDALVAGGCYANEGGDAWWDYGTDTSTGVTGWASDYYVSHFSQNTFGPC